MYDEGEEYTMRDEIRADNIRAIHNARFRSLYVKPQSMFGAVLVLLAVATVTLAVLHEMFPPTTVLR